MSIDAALPHSRFHFRSEVPLDLADIVCLEAMEKLVWLPFCTQMDASKRLSAQAAMPNMAPKRFRAAVAPLR